jgi:hypothetical protein
VPTDRTRLRKGGCGVRLVYKRLSRLRGDVAALLPSRSGPKRQEQGHFPDLARKQPRSQILRRSRTGRVPQKRQAGLPTRS